MRQGTDASAAKRLLCVGRVVGWRGPPAGAMRVMLMLRTLEWQRLMFDASKGLSNRGGMRRDSGGATASWRVRM